MFSWYKQGIDGNEILIFLFIDEGERLMGDKSWIRLCSQSSIEITERSWDDGVCSEKMDDVVVFNKESEGGRLDSRFEVFWPLLFNVWKKLGTVECSTERRGQEDGFENVWEKGMNGGFSEDSFSIECEKGRKERDWEKKFSM